jgi:3-dehydroquinate dehydratase
MMTKKKKERREMILSVVEEQLRNDEPKEVRLTLRRLTEGGYTEEEAKEKIAAVLLEEIYDVLKENAPYDEERYISRLRQLK